MLTLIKTYNHFIGRFSILCIIFLSFSAISSYASDNLINSTSINLTYYVANGSVSLRWIPPSPDIWNIGIKKGYYVEKRILSENGVSYSNANFNILEDKLILPLPPEKWDTVSSGNKYALVAREAIFGSSFRTYALSGNVGTDALNRAKETNDRFVFSMLSADFDFNAAVSGGWGIVDKHVAADGVYQYIVRLNNSNKITSDTITVRISSNSHLPKPFAVDVFFEENSALISWQNSATDVIYSYYIIERSTDGKIFTRVNDLPFVTSAADDNKSSLSRSSVLDSIPNYVPYFYRVKGVNRFGVTGPPSDVISGMAKKKLKSIPDILKNDFVTIDTIRLEWKFDQLEENLIKGFEIYRADSLWGNYLMVSALLPPSSRACNLKVSHLNFFIVKAVGVDDVSTESASHMIQVPDFSPPAAPKKPVGSIDTAGLIKIHWQPNNEEDLNGYFIFRGFSEKTSFLKLNQRPVVDTFFVDSINVRLGNEKIAYSIVAVDKAFNQSSMSDILVLNVPDLIRPSSPIFLKSSQSSGKVFLSWAPGISNDIEKIILFRKKGIKENWSVLTQLKKDQTTFVDSLLQEGESYQYKLIAVDDAGLESFPTPPLIFVIPPYLKPESVEKFAAKFDQQKMKISLKWKNDKKVKAYKLYKEENSSGPYYLSTLPGGENQFVDIEIKPFVKYTYRICAIGHNGLSSGYKEINVEWK